MLWIEEIEAAPSTPISRPFVVGPIGTVRRGCLDQAFSWNVVDLSVPATDVLIAACAQTYAVELETADADFEWRVEAPPG